MGRRWLCRRRADGQKKARSGCVVMDMIQTEQQNDGYACIRMNSSLLGAANLFDLTTANGALAQ